MVEPLPSCQNLQSGLMHPFPYLHDLACCCCGVAPGGAGVIVIGADCLAKSSDLGDLSGSEDSR